MARDQLVVAYLAGGAMTTAELQIRCRDLARGLGDKANVSATINGSYSCLLLWPSGTGVGTYKYTPVSGDNWDAAFAAAEAWAMEREVPGAWWDDPALTPQNAA